MEIPVGISSDRLARLLADAAASPDAEICGLLFGNEHRIDAALACANVAVTPHDSFEIDPAALIAAHRAMRQGGPRLIGHYHSHPNGIAQPSPRDAAAAGTPGDLWLILGNGDAQLWRVQKGGAWLGSFDRVSLDATLPCASRAPSP